MPTRYCTASAFAGSCARCTASSSWAPRTSPLPAAASSRRTTSRSSIRSSSESRPPGRSGSWRSPSCSRTRVLASVLRALGAFPVERGGGDHVAMSEAATLLRRGEVLGIFPQGTSKQLARRPWHRGAARLALVTGHADRSRPDDRHARVPSANARSDRGGRADRRRARASHRCRDERPHRAGRASSARRVVGTIPNRS